jgi:glycine/D-amino acid oxidase-like deaminating enzyme|tara:strand:+ start:2883 stop:4256 length:1374 start_codon:yes stop_codon:yes gene_type:complete
MKSSLYSQDMYKYDVPEDSLWESTQGDAVVNTKKMEDSNSCDVAIIGGGYTGLSAAYHLAKDYDIDVVVLEAGHIGWGASGRNGGFCSVGGVAESSENLIKKYSLEDVRSYYQSQVEAIELVRSNIIDEQMDIKIQGSAEIQVARSKRNLEEMTEHADFQRKYLGLNATVISKENLKESYFDANEQWGGVALKPTFGLHPLRYANGIAIAAIKNGAKLFSDSEVIDWEKNNGSHYLRTKSGTLKAKYVIFATNGFMPEYLLENFKARALPIISSIITTRVLTTEELAAHKWQTDNPVINSRKLVNYYRLLPDNRFLFGGRGSSSGDQAGAEKNYNYLIKVMRSIWPHWSNVEIEHKWHGFVCFTRRLTPSIGRLDDDPSVFFGFGYHGNGVNTSTWTGLQLAKWLGKYGNNNQIPRNLPNLVQGLSPKFPLSALRRYYLQGMIQFYRFKDAVRENRS